MNWKRAFIFACAVIGAGGALSCKDPLSTGDPRNIVVNTTVVVAVTVPPDSIEVDVGTSVIFTVTIRNTNQYDSARIDTITISGPNASNFAVVSMNNKFPWVIPNGDTASFLLRFSSTSARVDTAFINVFGVPNSNTMNISDTIMERGINSNYSLQLLSASQVNFGNVQANPNSTGDTTASPAQYVILKNTGAPFTLYGAAFSGGNPANFEVSYTPAHTPRTMQTGEIDTFYVSFIPSAPYQFWRTLDCKRITSHRLKPPRFDSQARAHWIRPVFQTWDSPMEPTILFNSIPCTMARLIRFH